MFGRVGIRPCQQIYEVGVSIVAGEHLGSVQHVVFAVRLGAHLQRGQVRAGVWLREPLAVLRFPPGDRRQVAGLLPRCAKLDDGGA